MNRTEFMGRFQNALDDALDIVNKKNADYASDSEPFANFIFAANLAGVSVPRGMLVRMGDKISRLRTLLDGEAPKVSEERLRDTLIDLANYALIMAVWLDQNPSA
jgi:hypothetical protein